MKRRLLPLVLLAAVSATGFVTTGTSTTEARRCVHLTRMAFGGIEVVQDQDVCVPEHIGG